MIEIRRAGEKQIPKIIKLADELWPATFTSILSAKQIAYMMEMMYSRESLEKQMNDGHQYAIVMENDVDVGYVSYEINHDNSDKTKIHKLYILPEHQRKGIGKIVVDYVAQEARRSQNSALFLNVNKHNESAIGFYEKHGFFLVKKEVIDIGNGFIMDDFVFELELNETEN
ncbi:MAG: GNAT family N-acetyltransferase [Dysgonamonadaceae bacterium]|nr:GNAT family N-acetyltransferase [Dysgonamonadaceae bacterium]MDD3728229.1 GNAT family N-acetyltransferase [Dysgonamonadaceae bacterium]MDD4606050.1 GNAT family N-acetyltransferase [Dysgonamonadaceae bacterium]HUI32453.1 GNAT family N-acetyltransferase [Dysgonamonadaceae bacterium]